MTTNVENDSQSVEAEGAGPESDARAGTSDPEAPGDADSLAARVAELENERVELMNRVTRTRADLSNLKRRSEQEIEDGRKFANQLFAGDVIRVVDSLDRALGAIPPSLHGFSWIDGILIFRAQVGSLLKAQGIEQIEALGEEFDPRYHEAVAQDGDAGAEGVVQETFQVGYTIHDRVLRPALVKVGLPEKDAESPEDPIGETADGDLEPGAE